MLKRKILTLALALSMAITAAYPAFADPEEPKSGMIEGEYEADFTQQAEEEEETVIAVPVKTANVSERAKKLLSSLGILTEAEMSINDFVQRNFAAEVLIRMTGLDTSEQATGTVYKDVEAESLYAYSIEQATDMGYFTGTGDGYFTPDGYITDKQMATLLLRFTGYEGKIQTNNAYGKLTKGVNLGDDLTYYDLAVMLSNMLDMGTLNLVDISPKGNTYSIDNDKTVLNAHFSVYTAEGIIKKNGKTGLFSGTDIPKDTIAVSTKDGLLTIKTGKTGVEKEIGKNVEVFYELDDRTNDRVAVGYVVSEDKNSIVSFSINDLDIASSTADKLVYYEGESERKIKYDPINTAIIYNGSYYSDGAFTFAILGNMEGNFTAIDNDMDYIYDVFYIEAYTPHRVKSVVLSTNTINFKDGGSITLDDSNYNEFSMTYSDGIKAYTEDFDENTVVSVMESCASAKVKTAKVIVSTAIAEGTVLALEENEAGHMTMTLEQDVKYRLVNTTFNENGKGVKVFVTFLGNAADVEVAGNVGFRFGILAKFKYDKREDKLDIRILNSNNQYEEYSFGSKLRIDGRTYKDASDASDALEAPTINEVGWESIAEIHRYPVRYRCNEDGALIEIDTPKLGAGETPNDSLQFIGTTAGSRKGYMNNYVLGFATPISPSTLFFNIGYTEQYYDTTDNDFHWRMTQETFEDTSFTSVSTAQSLASSYATRNISYYAYKCNGGNVAELVLTYSGPSHPTNNNSLFVYERQYQAYDEENGVPVQRFIGYSNGAKVDIAVDPVCFNDAMILGISEGDVFTYGTDLFGRLAHIWEVAKHIDTDSDGKYDKLNLKSVRDASGNDTLEKRIGNNDVKFSAAIIFGYVLERTGDLIHMRNIDLTNGVGNDKSATPAPYSDIKNPASTIAGTDVWIRIPASTSVTVYDPSADKKVYGGTYDEILSGARNSFVIIRYGSNTTIQEIAVLNEDF